MRFFFFGTLMDPQVRRLVIGRDPAAGRIEAAVLEGFRRVSVAGRPYPMLLPHRCGRVSGMLLHDLEADAVRRLIAFEGAEYHAAPVTVAARPGRLVTAAAFLADRSVAPSRRGWSLQTWQRRHKRAFLRRIGGLMDGYAIQAFLRGARPVFRRGPAGAAPWIAAPSW